MQHWVGRLLSTPVNLQCTKRVEWKGLMIGSGRGKERGEELSNIGHLCCEIVDWAGHTLVCKSLWKVGPYPGLIFCWLAHAIIEEREKRGKSSRVWVPFNSLDIPIKRLLARPLFCDFCHILPAPFGCLHSFCPVLSYSAYTEYMYNCQVAVIPFLSQ